MSERGSFCTEYIYCSKCFNVVKSILLHNEKYLCSVQIPTWTEHKDEALPIIAGKIGGSYPGEELFTMESKYLYEIEKGICHEVRIAVIADSGQKIYIAIPDNK